MATQRKMRRTAILIVEDDTTTSEVLVSELAEKFPNADIQTEESFDAAIQRLSDETDIDILILDLYEGGLERGNLTGQAIWDIVWEQRFIPVVVFTAGDVQLDPEPPPDNPFVRIVKKGAAGLVEVVEHLEEIEPNIQSLRSIRAEVDRAVQIVLKGASPHIWQLTSKDESVRSAMLVRAIRRRLAAMTDVSALQMGGIKAWEQYIFPPLEGSLLTGDVLRLKELDSADPSAFRLVLSPSCDLVARGGRRPRIEQALVAKCEGVNRFATAVRSKHSLRIDELVTKLPRFLTEAQFGGRLPLPSFGDVIPPMAADLRRLELVDVAQVSLDASRNDRYLRIASIDSPFRERIAWAYLSIAGRPGVPEIDVEEWAREIVAKQPGG